MELKSTFFMVIFILSRSGFVLLTSYGNTVQTKGQDGKPRPFIHPFLQVWGLALGQCLFLIMFLICKAYAYCTHGSYYSGRSCVNPLIHGVASLINVIICSLIFGGLTLTSASSYQMLYGSNLIFTSLSQRFLMRKSMSWLKWLAVCLLIVGSITVGSVPIFLSLGMEGLFSLIISTVLLVLIGFFKVSFEDALDGIAQLKNNPQLIGIELGAIACNLLEKLIVLYFTFVLMEPQKLTLNVVTPTLVWMVSLYALKLETFKNFQLVGFILMVLGALIFNEIIPKIGKCFHNIYLRMRTRFRRNEVGEDEPILPNPADEQLDESHLPSYGSLDSNYEELPTT